MGLGAAPLAPARAADKVVPPKLPIALSWSKDLEGPISAAPVSDGSRVYVPLKSAVLSARSIADGSEVWRVEKTVAGPLAAGGGLVFVSAGDAIEALRAADGKTQWILPRVRTAAPLAAGGQWLIAVTETEALAIKASDGRIAWRVEAGGVTLQPVLDGDRVYLAANDGRVVALRTDTGEPVWEWYAPEGVTALGAHRDRAYVGAGDKHLYCLDARGKVSWPRHVGSLVIGRISIDDERVYFAARDNVVRSLDRSTGNQRWTQPVRHRAIAGVTVRGRVVFVPLGAAELAMLYDRNGLPCGTISLAGETLGEFPPDVEETPRGLEVTVATGGLSNQWQLALYATTGELPMVPVAEFLPQAGADLLTDPVLQLPGRGLGTLLATDPPDLPAAFAGWPIILRDPPLDPFTALPGIQLRPLSPTLPPRREAQGPGG